MHGEGGIERNARCWEGEFQQQEREDGRREPRETQERWQIPTQSTNLACVPTLTWPVGLTRSRFEKEFDAVQDVFELQRNLNNAFAYDLVPSPSVVAAALKAARRVNDFATAVRIFEGVKAKVENKNQYQQYLDELKPLREELGVSLKEDLYPEEK
ncbi:cytochrome c oxidase, subunit VA/VI [Trichoderma novae-zelandiae]